MVPASLEREGAAEELGDRASTSRTKAELGVDGILGEEILEPERRAAGIVAQPMRIAARENQEIARADGRGSPSSSTWSQQPPAVTTWKAASPWACTPKPQGALSVERQKTVLETRRSRSRASIASESIELDRRLVTVALFRLPGFEMRLQRLGCRAKVSLPGSGHHRRQEAEDASWDHLELVIDAGALAFGGEEEAMTTRQRLKLRNDPHPLVALKLLELLDHLAEASQLPLES